MNTKRCPGCGEVKEFKEYSNDKYTKDGLQSRCKKCCAAAQAKYRQENPEKPKASHAKWDLNHPGGRRNHQLIHRYGITLSDYNAMLEAQGGRCAISGDAPDPNAKNTHNRVLHIDHCHYTNQVRALLCYKCNQGLGYFNHDPVLMRVAADYLEEMFIKVEKVI